MYQSNVQEDMMKNANWIHKEKQISNVAVEKQPKLCEIKELWRAQIRAMAVSSISDPQNQISIFRYVN